MIVYMVKLSFFVMNFFGFEVLLTVLCCSFLGFSQAFYFIIKSHDSAGLYEDYHTTWIGRRPFYCT
jgi:hypothetical protein